MDSGTDASGRLNNPETTYSGNEGTATVCLIAYDSADVAVLPTNANVSGLPCAQSLDVHFADTVGTANDDAPAYIGAALGNGPDFYGETPAATDLILTQMECSGIFALAMLYFDNGLASSDATGSTQESTTNSFMDFGEQADYTHVGIDDGVSAKTITFNSGEFYWKAPLQGV